MSNLKIEFTPAGFDYVRRVLGTRPYDEAGPLIAEMEQQKAAQEGGAGKVPGSEPVQVPAGVLEAVAGALKNGAGKPLEGAV